ncbi:hypothetical protein [Paenibacillus catalpae]|uniref:hypothetical protein n=1 Tax=Paenibacillus catalpae TaxID=1045775 RepID=UPI00158799E5|nr:hypothetical protein [Paenibacillus catalpae]
MDLDQIATTRLITQPAGEILQAVQLTRTIAQPIKLQQIGGSVAAFVEVKGR